MRAGKYYVLRPGSVSPTLYAPLTVSSVLSKGLGSPTFTRNSTATAVDFEGLLKTAIANEIRYQGARRVRNYMPFSFVQAAGTNGWAGYSGGTYTIATGTSDPYGGNTAVTVTMTGGGAGGGIIYSIGGSWGSSQKIVTSVWLRVASGTNSVSITGQGSDGVGQINVTATTVWKRFATDGTGTAGKTRYFILSNIGAGESIEIYAIQLEDVAGQTNQSPSEYVSNGVLSAPYHGAGVNGVKYFPYLNGNTVTNNVVTEAVGLPINAATLQGEVSEVAATNLCLQSEVFKTTWVASNIGIIDNSVIAPDGNTTADTLTASAGNGTLLQTITSASAARCFSIWLKRLTGIGNIDLTIDNGTAWTTLAVTATWTRFFITQAAVTNPAVGLRIVTNADAVYVWGSHLENSSYPTSYIATTTASATRAADVLSYPTSGNLPTNNFTITQSWTPEAADMGTVTLFGSYTDASNYLQILHDGTNLIFRKRIGGTNYDAAIPLTYVAGTTYKIVARQSATSGMDIFVNSVKGTTNTNTTNAVVASTMQVGADGNSLVQDNGAGKELMIYPKALTDAKCRKVTT